MKPRKEEEKMEDKLAAFGDGAKGLRSLADLLELAADLISTHGLQALLNTDTKQPELFASEPKASEREQEQKTLSLTDVRKILAEKSRAGHTDQVRLLLEKYGADKLSAIDPSHYKNLVDEAECLGATIDDLKTAIEEKTKAGLGDKLQAVFEHHHATSLEDLKPSYYLSFLRDMKGLTHE
jgi:acyl-ACP thioesterase